MKNLFLLITLLSITIPSFGQWQTNGRSIYVDTVNVGIGTSNPNIGAKLDIVSKKGENELPLRVKRDSADYPDYAIQTWNNNKSELMRVTFAGNTGIGVKAPKEKLEVNGNVFIKENNALILSSPNGTQFRLTVTDNGELRLTPPLMKASKEAIEKRNLNGCFVLFNSKNQTYQYINEARCDSSYLPASTFKIINSLISLETNAVSGIYETIKWDGKTRFLKEWNKDHNLSSGIKYSVVWFYQELARRVGRENMQMWVDSVNYGNRKLGKDIDKFWLEGDIRISAKQQIDFLLKLINNELPFTIENQELVKQIMLTDSTKNYQVHSKTGWAMRAKKQIGWLVGYVVANDNTWIFACNIDIRQNSDAKYRKEIVYEVLRKEGIIK